MARDPTYDLSLGWLRKEGFLGLRESRSQKRTKHRSPFLKRRWITGVTFSRKSYLEGNKTCSKASCLRKKTQCFPRCEVWHSPSKTCVFFLAKAFFSACDGLTFHLLEYSIGVYFLACLFLHLKEHVPIDVKPKSFLSVVFDKRKSSILCPDCRTLLQVVSPKKNNGQFNFKFPKNETEIPWSKMDVQFSGT